MKKSLIAVAVAAALPAAAYAQTNVQMYGIADVSLEFLDEGATGTGDSDIRLSSSNASSQSTSRWGVQGSEDLGGGLSANFRYEMAVIVDTGGVNANLFSRQARVGLKGGFGEIRLGRQYTPVFYSSIENDFTAFGFYNNHVGIASSAIRLDNMVEYRNKFGGFELIGAWAPGESSVAAGVVTDPDDIFGIAAIYNGASWGINGGYHDEGVQTIAAIGGKFGIGGFRVGLNYAMADRENNTERTDIDVSLAAKLGASGELILNVLTREDDGATGDGIGGALIYTHALSKRTNWYAEVGFNDDDNAADTATRVALGIRHLF